MVRKVGIASHMYFVEWFAVLAQAPLVYRPRMEGRQILSELIRACGSTGRSCSLASSNRAEMMRTSSSPPENLTHCVRHGHDAFQPMVR
jgi:hypothetical protein